MWTSLLILAVVFLVAIRISLTGHNQMEVISAGLVATACLMIVLSISPLWLKLALLATLFLIEGWLFYYKPASEG